MKTVAAIVTFVAMLAAVVVLLRLLVIIPLWLLTSLSGWRNLSFRFPENQSDPDSTTYRSRSVRLGGIDYGSCVDVLLSQKHVSLRIGWWFRAFHPNICIPRSQLKLGARTKMWFTEFRIAGDDTTIWFDKKITREFLKSSHD